MDLHFASYSAHFHGSSHPDQINSSGRSREPRHPTAQGRNYSRKRWSLCDAMSGRGGGGRLFFLLSPPLFGLKMDQIKPYLLVHSSVLTLSRRPLVLPEAEGWPRVRPSVTTRPPRPARRRLPLHSRLNGFPLEGPWLIPDAYSILRGGTVAETLLRQGATTTATTKQTTGTRSFLFRGG